MAPASRFSCPFCWGAGTAAEAFILISLGRQFIERLALRIDKDACYLLTLPRSAQQDCNAPVTCALSQNEKRPRFQEIHHACGTASPMIAYARPSDGLFWQIMLPERLRLDDCTLSTYPSIHSFPFQAHRLWPREFRPRNGTAGNLGPFWVHGMLMVTSSFNPIIYGVRCSEWVDIAKASASWSHQGAAPARHVESRCIALEQVE